jgi:hypothetical protein
MRGMIVSVSDGGALRCLDRPRADTGDPECTGTVELRPSLSGTGTPIARCDGHWAARQAFQRRHERDYPDSPVPPRWFDPAAAGERWNEDD